MTNFSDSSILLTSSLLSVLENTMSEVEQYQLDTLRGRRVLVIVAHADDPTGFCGATLARMADAGAQVTVLRVTVDDKDSVGLDIDETVVRNSAEFQVAMELLGVADTIDLGYPSDCLGDVSETELRERFIHAVRTVQPYLVVSYDPYGAYYEDNQDHIRVAAAVDETYWTAMFDKHHPEHFDEGLQPHGVVERWYFARRLVEVTHVVDATDGLSRKIEAALAHDTMMRNLVHQLRLKASTAGRPSALLDDAATGDLRPLLEPMYRRRAAQCGARYGLAAAEEWRVVRFDELDAIETLQESR